MKRFHFSLQALQVLRQRQEQIALKEYAQAMAGQRTAADNLRIAKEDCALAWVASLEQLRAGAIAGEIAQLKRFCQQREDRQQQCESELREAERAVEAKWKRLVLARQRREAVDKFYERQRRQYERACQHETEKLLDEIAHRRLADRTVWNVAAIEGRTLS